MVDGGVDINDWKNHQVQHVDSETGVTGIERDRQDMWRARQIPQVESETGATGVKCKNHDFKVRIRANCTFCLHGHYVNLMFNIINIMNK